MSTLNTDLGLTIGARVDTSQAQKDIDAFTRTDRSGTNRRRSIVLKADVDLKEISDKLNNAITKGLTRDVDASMQKVSTSIKSGLARIVDGETFNDLTKVTERFKSNFGEIVERVTVFKDGAINPLTSSIQVIKKGVQDLNTQTEVSIGKMGEFDAKITETTKTITDTNGETTQIIEKTTEWIDADGKLNQQLEVTNKEGQKLSATQTKICTDTKKVTKLTNELAVAMGKVQAPKNEKTSTLTYVDKNGVKTVKQMVDGVTTLTTKTREYTTAQGALVRETRTFNSLTGDTKVHTEIIKNKQEEIQKSKELQEQLQREREARKRIEEGLISTTTKQFTTTTTQFGDDSGHQYYALATSIEKVDEAGKKTIETIYEFTNAEGQLVKQTRTLDENGRKVAQDTIEISNATDKASKSTQRLADSTRNASTEQKTFGQALGDALKRLARYYIASMPIQALRKAITEAITTVKEFDSALIEFRKVSDLAGESLTRYVAKLAEMGEVTGSTMQAMVEAATEFRKSGFTDDDSAKLASIAEKYRNIADEEISAGESASFIIAQMKAFNIEAGQAEHIIDSVNEVANNFSVSSADLAKNLGNMSAIMAINNVSMEEQIGMLTGVTEITRNASSASRGLVMISSRLTQVLDDTSSTGKKLTKIYKDLGIELKDEKGQLRSHYDILSDLAIKWNTLSENQQKYIALTSAGARQQQNFVALMANWNQVADATTTAYKSMGSAQKENEKVMDSITKKVEIFKSQFQQLVIGEGGLQDFAKKILDLGNALLKFVNTDIGQTILGFVALETATVAVVKSWAALQALLAKSAFWKAILEAQTFSASLKILATKIKEVTVAWASSPFGVATVLVGGIYAVVKAYDYYNKRQERVIENLNKLSETAQNTQSELENTEASLKQIQEQIKINNEQKLQITNKADLEILDKENSALKDQEETLKRQIELLELKLKIENREAEEAAKKAYYETDASNINNPSVLESFGRFALNPYSPSNKMEAVTEQVTPSKELDLAIEKIGELTKKKNDLYEQSIKEARQNGKTTKTYKDLNKQIDELDKEIIDVQSAGQKAADTLDTIYESLKSNDEETVNLRNSINSQRDAWLNVNNEVDKAITIYNRLAKLGEGGNVDLTIRPRIDTELLNKAGYEAGEGVATVFTHTFTNKANDIAVNFTPIMVDPNTGEFLGVMESGEFEKYCEDVVNGVREDDLHLQIGVEFKKEDYDDFVGAAEDAAQEIHELHEAQDALKQGTQIATDALEEEIDGMEDVEDTADETEEKLKELQEAYTNAMSATSTLVSSISKVSSALKEQAESGSLAIDTQLDLIDAGYGAALAYDEETGACKLDEEAVQALVEAKLQMQIANLQTIRSNLSATLLEEANNATVAAGAFINLAKAKNVASKAYVDRSGADPSSSIAGWGGNAGYLKATDQIQALDKQIEALEHTLGSVKKSGVKAFGDIGKSAGGAKGKTDDLKDSVNDLKSQYDKVITYITGKIDDYVKSIQKAKDEAIKAVEAEIKAKEKQKDKELDKIEKQIKKLEKEKKAREKYWNEQIDALKKANQERKDALELQEKLDALEKAKNTRVKIYKEGQGFVYDVDRTEVAKAQKALDEYLSEKAYEDELERLNALKDAEAENYEKRLESLNSYKDRVQASYEKQIAALEEHKQALEEQYDAQIEYYNNFKENFEKMVKAYEDSQTALLAKQLTGIDFEKDNWMTRLGNLAEFVNKYNALQKQIGTGTTDASGNADMKSGNTYNGDGGSKNLRDKGYSDSRTSGGEGLSDAAKKKLGIHASGVSSVKQDEIAIVGENPNKEIVLGSKVNNGELMALDKGTGVINANSTKTLASMLNQVGQFGASGFGSGNGTLNSNINNDSLVVNGVTIQGANIKDPQTFVNGLLNMKAEALQRAYRNR